MVSRGLVRARFFDPPLAHALRASLTLLMQCIVIVNPERFQLVVPDSNGMQLWSGLPLVTLFEHGKVESLNNNQVAFEMVVENLERALKSAQYSTECVCKVRGVAAELLR